jgi:hypothetical protein
MQYKLDHGPGSVNMVPQLNKLRDMYCKKNYLYRGPPGPVAQNKEVQFFLIKNSTWILYRFYTAKVIY